MSAPRIAFLGTGLMGLPMAKNLLAAGHSVAAWNRTRAKAETLGSAHGAQVRDDFLVGKSGAPVPRDNC